MELLKMDGITKKFGNAYANKNITLSVKEGEVHTLLGENGAGKSTLMNILIGLYQPTIGDIYLKGEKVKIDTPAKAVKLGIGMVHQHFMLVEAMTVFENIILGTTRASSAFIKSLMSKTNQIGFIGGMELDTTKQKLASYEAAAKAVNPKIQVVSAYANSFSDSAKGKEIADSMVTASDVDIMFGDASAVDSGAREALGKYEGRYDIGQPSDLLATQESEVVISSVVTDNATLIGLCMEDVKAGTFGNKTIYGNLSNKTLSVGTFSASVPAEIQTQFLEIVEKIKAGTFIQ